MNKLKSFFIRKLGLKGSWYWAKKQMSKGEIVRCVHWTGALKLRTSPEMVNNIWGENPKKSTLLQANYTRNNPNAWETSNHHLSYEEFTDYELFNW